MSTAESERRTTVVNRSAAASTIIPVLVYEGVSKAIAWLCGAFGSTECLRSRSAGN